MKRLEDRDEEVMDRIDAYLLLELLDWWKRRKESWIGSAPSSYLEPSPPVCPTRLYPACTAQSLHSCCIIYDIVLAIVLYVLYMMAQHSVRT